MSGTACEGSQPNPVPRASFFPSAVWALQACLRPHRSARADARRVRGRIFLFVSYAIARPIDLTLVGCLCMLSCVRAWCVCICVCWASGSLSIARAKGRACLLAALLSLFLLPVFGRCAILFVDAFFINSSRRLDVCVCVWSGGPCWPSGVRAVYCVHPHTHTQLCSAVSLLCSYAGRSVVAFV